MCTQSNFGRICISSFLRALNLHSRCYTPKSVNVLSSSLPINQFVPLHGDKCGSFQVSKRPLFIWAFCCFVREIESPEFLLNFPLWHRGRGKVDARVTVSQCDSSLPDRWCDTYRHCILCPCEEIH